MKTLSWLKGAVLLLIIHQLSSSPVRAQSPEFTYQGRLDTNGVPVAGAHDFEFRLFDAASGGTQLGDTNSLDDVAVSGGLFTVTLDFGDVHFDGSPRWLEIAVRPGSSTNGFATLAPRQRVTATPYAIRSANAGSAEFLDGTISSNNIAPGTITSSMIATGAVGAAAVADGSLTAADVNSASFSNTFWKVNGNAGTTAGTHFLGTTDNQALEIKVNSLRAVRVEPNSSGAPNIIGGAPINSASAGIVGGFIGGGGATNHTGSTYSNRIANHFTVIGGGRQNTASGLSSTIGGGEENIASSHANFVGAGRENTASGVQSAVVGGFDNLAAGAYAFVGGGFRNEAQTNAEYSAVVGGQLNVVGDNADASFIGGGSQNRIETNSWTAVIGGGAGNYVGTGDYGVIVGGSQNRLNDFATSSFIGSGDYNTVETFAGRSAVVGGYANQVKSNASLATIPGGLSNVVAGAYGFAAGHSAQAMHSGTFVWSDASGASFASTASNQFLIRASGGVGINTNSTSGVALNVAGTVRATEIQSASFTGNGGSMTNLNASQLISGAVPLIALSNAWKLGGNYGTTPGTHFLGTTDNQPLDLYVNYRRALRLEPSTNIYYNAPNLVGGHEMNVASNGIGGTFIGGGGSYNQPNSVGASYAAVVGGIGNTASGFVSTTMGAFNTASGLFSVAAGYETVAGGNYALAAGRRAKANHMGAFVWADSQDADFASTATNQFLIRASGGMGIGETAPEAPLHVTEGSAGTVTASGSSVAVFERNSHAYVSILTPTNGEAGVLFGNPNHSADGGVLFNGNTPRGLEFRTGGNSVKMVIESGGDVGIGTTDPLSKLHISNDAVSPVASALENDEVIVSAADAVIGLYSPTSGTYGSALAFKEIQGDGTILDNWSLVRETTLSASDFFLTYGSSDNYASNPALLTIRTNGNVGIGTTNPTNKLHVAGGVSATAFVNTSDRNAKENFAPVSPTEVLAKVVELPISTWTFKEMKDGRHMGPMAQDFYAAFGLGGGETTITSVDPDGVALAAIQGLNQKIEGRSQKTEDKLRKLEAENAALKQEMNELKQLVRTMTNPQNKGAQ